MTSSTQIKIISKKKISNFCHNDNDGGLKRRQNLSKGYNHETINRPSSGDIFLIFYCFVTITNQPQPQEGIDAHYSAHNDDNDGGRPSAAAIGRSSTSRSFRRRLAAGGDDKVTKIQLPRPKILLGIFTTLEEASRRKFHSEFLNNHRPKVCSLGEYQKHYSSSDHQSMYRDCEVIYTFVVGAAKQDKGEEGTKRTEIVQPTVKILISKDDSATLLKGQNGGESFHCHDCTLLNIQYV